MTIIPDDEVLRRAAQARAQTPTATAQPAAQVQTPPPRAPIAPTQNLVQSGVSAIKSSGARALKTTGNVAGGLAGLATAGDALDHYQNGRTGTAAIESVIAASALTPQGRALNVGYQLPNLIAGAAEAFGPKLGTKKTLPQREASMRARGYVQGSDGVYRLPQEQQQVQQPVQPAVKQSATGQPATTQTRAPTVGQYLAGSSQPINSGQGFISGPNGVQTFGGLNVDGGRPAYEGGSPVLQTISRRTQPSVSQPEESKQKPIVLPQLKGGQGIFSALQEFQGDAAAALRQTNVNNAISKNQNISREENARRDQLGLQQEELAQRAKSNSIDDQSKIQQLESSQQISGLRNQFLALNDQNDPGGLQRAEITRKLSGLSGGSAGNSYEAKEVGGGVSEDGITPLPKRLAVVNKSTGQVRYEDPSGATQKQSPNYPNGTVLQNEETGQRMIVRDGHAYPY